MVVIDLGRQDFCVIAFENTHSAISTQKHLQDMGFTAYIMPTPREIAAGCGLSLRFPPERYQEARRLVEAQDIPSKYCHFYRMTYDENHRQVVPMEG